MTNRILYQDLELELGRITLGAVEIPEFVKENLKHDFFEWQKKAMQYFLAYNNPDNSFCDAPTHLMFNMATGSGKTMLMAACLLYYYERGYRHFIFFVNQKNIVDKTENNFVNIAHNKYLFKEKIVIDDKTVPIRQVDTFSDSPQGIEIKFTTIQKLYNDIHIEKENQTTLEDLHQRDIVMLADEAHHLNTDTSTRLQELDLKTELRDSTSKKEVERKGWEHTVINLILNKNGEEKDNNNVLLEFTATVPANESVQKKYEDKIIAKFGIQDFLQAGYTKEINLISTTLNKKERVLHALAFHWYRHKIALENDLANFKPVILFRSKTIAESQQDYGEFMEWVDNIDSSDFEFLEKIKEKINPSEQASLVERGKFSTEKLLEFIGRHENGYKELAQFIKDNFTERAVIITNSKSGTQTKEKTTDAQDALLNSLEDKNNHIRAIFTVKRLTEGWDVLNLFDIVRLYQGQNAGGSTKKTPEATTQEKQLIGRGVRYYPFDHSSGQRNKRKFDGDLDNDARILEELFYYTYDEESRYISHLKDELRKEGYLIDKKKPVRFDLKDEFKQSNLYQQQKLWYNERENNSEQREKGLEDIKADFSFEYEFSDIEMSEYTRNFDEDGGQVQEIRAGMSYTIDTRLGDIEKHIFQKAVNIKAKQDGSIFRFENLCEKLSIDSTDDLQQVALKDIAIHITSPVEKYDDIDANEKLAMCLKFLDELSVEINEKIHLYKGGEFKLGDLKAFFNEPKTKVIDKDTVKEIPDSWYALDKFVGTDEEEALVKFIKARIGNLREGYEEVHLLKNEEVYKIYDFEQGRGFQPDFLLFLKAKNGKEIYYQVFIEPKGNHLMEIDAWKNTFLKKIAEKYSDKGVLEIEGKGYKLIGLPFFNDATKENDFVPKFNELLKSQGIETDDNDEL